MIPVATAQEKLLAHVASVPKPPPETLSIAAAIGRILARDVMALRDQPPFAASAMDGYAVRWADVQSLPTTLQVSGESHAGKRYSGSLAQGEAIRIFTGAPVPPGADTILLQEDTSCSGNTVIVSGRPDKLGGHLRPAALDAHQGQLLARAGERLSAARAGWIAAAAVASVNVAPRPRVDLVMCGDELRLPGQSLGADQIVSTNGLVLDSLLRDSGADVVGSDNIIPDDLDALTAVFKNSQAQLIVTAGGASVGARDFVQEAIRNAGGEIDFWKIAMRPGKPLMVGRTGDKIIIGLPGNPVSAFVGAILFALPAIRALQGATDILPKEIPATWSHAGPANGARADYVRVRLKSTAAGLTVEAHAMQDSSMLSVLAAADALAIIPAGSTAFQPGDPVSVILL
jgi:molybdopterin molybdotransferase